MRGAKGGMHGVDMTSRGQLRSLRKLWHRCCKRPYHALHILTAGATLNDNGIDKQVMEVIVRHSLNMIAPHDEKA
jgi:hypothetical protein